MIFHPCVYKIPSGSSVVGIAGCREIDGKPEFILNHSGYKEYMPELTEVQVQKDFLNTEIYKP